MLVLAGDIGGTNARLALVDITESDAQILTESRYPSQQAPGLAPIVRAFLKETGTSVERACFGVAGPIVDEVARTSNLPWVINRRELANEIGIPHTALINDFAAAGHGVPWLRSTDYETLQEGEQLPRAPIALIGAGTGLGQAFLVWCGGGYQVLPSEGGHASFAARNTRELGFREWMAPRFRHLSAERALSGEGLVNLYRYLAETGAAPEQARVLEEMQAEDPAAVVSRHGLAGDDDLCVEALSMFVSAYGSQAGNLALMVLSRGGVYVGGGIAPRIMPALRDGEFLEAFQAKGRMRPLLQTIPVRVITSNGVALLGSAAVAAQL